MNLALEEAVRAAERDTLLVARGVATKEIARASSAREKLARTDLMQSQANRDRASLEFERAQDALKKSRVLAPIAGTVVAVGIEVGQLVAPLSSGFSSGGSIGGLGSVGGSTTPHVVIADLTELEARLDVDELDVARVAPGQPVQIRAQGAQGETLRGTVTEVGLLGQQSGGAVMFPVEISIERDVLPPIGDAPKEGPSGPTMRALRPGMTVSADIEVERREHAIAVPLASVLEGDGRTTSDRVFVLNDLQDGHATVTTRAVTLGSTEEDVIAILSGIAVGEQVVEGPFRALRALDDGDAVTVTETIPLPGTPEAEALAAKKNAPKVRSEPPATPKPTAGGHAVDAGPQ